MYVVRILGAWLLGLLTVIFLILLWLAALAISAIALHECTGMAFAGSCSISNGRLIGFAIWACVATAPAAWMIFETVKLLGEWASRRPEGRAPTVVAWIVAGLFVLAAAVSVAVYVSIRWGSA